jgi:hypothetical protein
MRVEGVRQPAGEPVRQRKSPANTAEIARTVDAATLRAVARNVHRGAWWRRVRRQGLTGAPGVAQAVGILAVLSCLVAGGGVSLSVSPGLFRGGEMSDGVDHAAARAASRPRSPSGQENDAMRAMKFSAAVVVGSLAASGAASAQTAVEWKVSDGGNGHWYAVSSVSGTWPSMRLWAEERGGHLAAVNSQNEWVWLKTNLSVVDAFVGGFQDHALPSYSEPAGGWCWVTGEPFALTSYVALDDCPGGRTGSCGCGTPGAQDVLFFTGCCDRQLDDIGDGIVSNCDSLSRSGVIEWSADCNSDGIVDYGQILAGELDDTNANNIPDCCEQGTACPVNIVTNGSFEAGTPLNACTSETVASGNALGIGWMVTAGSAQRVRASATCATQGTPKFGDFFVDLLDAGEIRQAIATTPGRSYRLTFWLSGDCAGGPTTKRVTAALGTASQNFDHACSGTGTQAWRSCSLEFIASASITTLSLKSAAGGASNGPLVDGVRVEDISISCPGDVDGDGEVTGGDVGLVLLNFGECPSN